MVRVTEQVFEGFERTGSVRSSVLLDEIFEGLWEPADNAIEHGQSEVGVVCLAQTWRINGGRFAEVAVVDAGVGILETLRRRYPGLSSHQEAIKKALEEGVSGLDDKQRGLGLTKTHQVSTSGADRRLTIVSGDGCVVATPDRTSGRTLTKSWSGLCIATLPIEPVTLRPRRAIRPIEEIAVIETSVELGAHGRAFATRGRAREIAAVIRRDYQPEAQEVVLDLSSVALAGTSFMNEFAGEMGALWTQRWL